MDAYTGFAAVYDTFMDNIPYEEWCEYLCELLQEQGIYGGLLLDMGCGTGSLTELLSSRGYDMIAIDNSEDMLQIAMEKRDESGQNILYLLQDMRELELYGTVGAVVSICDSMNYLTEYDDLVKVMRLVNNYLDPGGIFIFDMNTIYKYQSMLGESTIAENREECSFIWDNHYDADTMLNEYDLALFVEEEQGLYRKHEEVHVQKAYSPETVKQAIAEAGMEFVAAYDAFTKNPPEDSGERFYMIARERGKKEKRKSDE